MERNGIAATNTIYKIVSLIIILLIASAAVFLCRGSDYSKKTLTLDALILDHLAKKGIDENNLVYEKKEAYKKRRHAFLKIERRYKVGPDFNVSDFVSHLKKAQKGSNFNIAKTIFTKEASGENFLITLSFKNEPLYTIKFTKPEYSAAAKFKPKKGKIAIVLDDFGYNMRNADVLIKEINFPLTISILPNLPYSKEVAKKMKNRNFEVILHLPLEPHTSALNLEKGTIMTNMPAEETDDLLAKALKGMPKFKGVSNHMGSKATEDYALMKQLFDQFKKRGLYFLDNRVTGKSVCEEVARDTGVRIASRNIFLDNKSDEAYIERQILRTAEVASREGRAVGIGHARPSTVKVLAKVIPQLKNEGFQFVYVSELVE